MEQYLQWLIYMKGLLGTLNKLLTLELTDERKQSVKISTCRDKNQMFLELKDLAIISFHPYLLDEQFNK